MFEYRHAKLHNAFLNVFKNATLVKNLVNFHKFIFRKIKLLKKEYDALFLYRPSISTLTNAPST